MQNQTIAGRRAVHGNVGNRAAAALLVLALGTACSKGEDAPAGDSAALSPASAAPAVDSASTTPAVAPAAVPADSARATTDSARPTATTPAAKPAGQTAAAAAGPANKRETRAQTSPTEAAKLDANTRTAAKQGAATRDTAATGAVTPAPAARKTAATKPASPTTPSSNSTSGTAKTDSAVGSASTAASGTDSGQQSAGQQQAGGQQQAAAGGDKLTASPAAYQGWKTFHVYCYRCHGTDAMGSDLAPNLRHSVSAEGSVTHDVFVTTVKEGRVPKGMPAWGSVLSDEQIENLYAYIRARSNGSLAAGRPKQGS